jgi:large subunit ribosomal protein L10
VRGRRDAEGSSGAPAPARPRGPEHGGDPLRRDEKEAAIAALSERLAASETVFAADYRGLTVKQMAELRGRLRDAGTEFTVVKNSLARRAAAETGRDALLAYLEGPTAIAWVAGDAAVAAKALNGFAVEHPDALTVKGGLLEGADLPSADVARLARLPARDQLLAQLAGGLAAPLSGLAGGLSNLIGGLARSLAALQEQRAAEAPAD